MKPRPRCRACGTALEGCSELCVPCYARLLVPCRECMVREPGDSYRVRRQGKPPVPVDCAVCHNERWLLEDYIPAK